MGIIEVVGNGICARRSRGIMYCLVAIAVSLSSECLLGNNTVLIRQARWERINRDLHSSGHIEIA